MRRLHSLALLLILIGMIPCHARAATTPVTTPSESNSPADTSALTGSGPNGRSWAIDRPTSGGVMRKDPGGTTWYFIKGLTEAEVRQRADDLRQRLLREHGDEPRDIFAIAATPEDRAVLAGLGVVSAAALPCTLRATVRYRDLERLSEMHIRHWGNRDRLRSQASPERAGPIAMAEYTDPRRRPEAASPASATSTLSTVTIFSDGFERTSLGSDWSAGDYNASNGSDYWWPNSSGCTYVHGGSYALDCAGVSDQPCFQYDNYMDAYCYNPYFINTSAYNSIDISFWLKYDTEATYDVFEWYYQTPSSGWIYVTGRSGSGGWSQLGQTIANGYHTADGISLQFRFISDYSNVLQGAQVDDVLLRGTPFQANLTWTTPGGWSGPVVPSSVTGTNTYGTLYATPLTTYLDGAILNNGDLASGSFYVDFYLDGLTYLGRTSVGSISPGGQSYIQDFPTTVYSAGSHYVQMRIDATNVVSEQFETDNNVSSPNLTWNPAPKDIVIDQVTVTPSLPLVGQTIDVAVTFRNAGPADITSNFLVDFYRNRASQPPLGTPGDQSQIVFQPFTAYTTRTLHFYDTYGSPTTWSSYVFADRNGEVSEANETNNIAGPIAITWSSGNVVVSGRFAYDDSLGGTDRPAKCVKVKIYDQDPLTGNPDPDDDLLAETYTNESGQFGPVTLLNRDQDQADLGLLDLYVVGEFSTSTSCRPSQAVVMQDDQAIRYSLQSAVATNAANGPLDFGTMKPTDSPRKRALHIYHTLLRGYDWVIARGNTPSPVIAMWYPGNDDHTSYDPPTTTISINSKVGLAADGVMVGPDDYDDYPILHEYGHHIAYILGTAPVLSGCPALDYSHLGCAMSEGWPDWFASQMVQAAPTSLLRDWNQNTATPSDTSVLTRNLETGVITWRNGDPPYDGNDDGETYIPCVFSTLWDVSDAANDNQPPGSCADELSDPVSRTWQAGTVHPNDPMNNLCDFRNLYYKTFILGDATATAHFNNTFCEHGVVCGGQLAVGPPGPGANVLWLGPAQPNPSRGEARLRFHLPSNVLGTSVSLVVYDVAGARMKTLYSGVASSAEMGATWDGRTERGTPCHAGIYFVRLKAGEAGLTTTLVRLE